MAKPVDCAHIRKERDLLIANLDQDALLKGRLFPTQPLLELVDATQNWVNDTATEAFLSINKNVDRLQACASADETQLLKFRVNQQQINDMIALLQRIDLKLDETNTTSCYSDYITILFVDALRCMFLYFYHWTNRSTNVQNYKERFQKSIDKLARQHEIMKNLNKRLTCQEIQETIVAFSRELRDHVHSSEVTEKVRKIITGTNIQFSELQSVLYSERYPTATTATKTNQSIDNFRTQARSTLDAIRLDTANLKSCYEVYVNVYFPIFLCFKFLTGLKMVDPTDSLQPQQVLIELEMEDMIRDLPTARFQTVLPGKTALTPVQIDINRLLEHGDILIEDEKLGLEPMTFDVRTLEALDTSRLRDFFGRNKYFDLSYSEKKIRVKKGIYGLRYLKDVAVLLQAAITTATGIKPLRYASPDVDVELNKLLDDINYNFEYIKPRLNVVTTELFSSPKSTAITRALNPIKALNKTEGKYNIPAIKAKIADVLGPLKAEIDTARAEAKSKNTKGAINELKEKKERYGEAVDKLLKKANFEVERKMIREERDKVLKEWDSWTRTKYLFTGRNTEGGKRTRKNRH